MANITGINHRIYEKYKGSDLKEAIKLFKKSHKTVMALIEKHTDCEIASKPQECIRSLLYA
jgi:hypothetical protein